MKKTLIAVLAAVACAVSAQESSPNIVYTTLNPPPVNSQYSWSGFEITDSGGGGIWGGHMPAYNPWSGQFMFGYMPSTISYAIGVNSVLSGTGLKVSGIQYGLEYWNQDYSRGSLSTTVSLWGSKGEPLQSYYHALPQTTAGWTSFDQSKTFDSPYLLSAIGTATMTFTGNDDRFWAGHWGPQLRNPYIKLTYAVEPPPPPPPPPQLPVVPNTSTTTVQVTPTETVTTETVSVISVPTAEVQQTTTALISSPAPVAAATTAAVSAPTATPTRSAAPAGNSAAVNMVLRNNAAQQAALQSSNLSASIQQSQTAVQDSGSASSGVSSDSVSLGMSSFNTASRQQSEAMSTMDAANPTSTRNLLNMMTARPADTEQQEREDRAARATAAQSSSAQSVGADLGTGVSMTALAQVPVGYSAYSVQLISQVPFYSDRTVYQNQRTVDNARALRQLTNDSRHRDMVEQQYRR